MSARHEAIQIDQTHNIPVSSATSQQCCAVLQHNRRVKPCTDLHGALRNPVLLSTHGTLHASIPGHVRCLQAQVHSLSMGATPHLMGDAILLQLLHPAGPPFLPFAWAQPTTMLQSYGGSHIPEVLMHAPDLPMHLKMQRNKVQQLYIADHALSGMDSTRWP